MREHPAHPTLDSLAFLLAVVVVLGACAGCLGVALWGLSVVFG